MIISLAYSKMFGQWLHHLPTAFSQWSYHLPTAIPRCLVNDYIAYLQQGWTDDVTYVYDDVTYVYDDVTYRLPTARLHRYTALHARARSGRGGWWHREGDTERGRHRERDTARGRHRERDTERGTQREGGALKFEGVEGAVVGMRRVA